MPGAAAPNPAASTPLQQGPRDAQVSRHDRWMGMALVFALGVGYCLTSAGLIAYNKFLISEGRFPYAVPLVLCHACFCSVMAGLLYLVFPSLFPSLTDPEKKVAVDRDLILKGALPIAIFFAGQLSLSNTAYLHSSVAFLQMMKEANLALVYTFSLAVALEKFHWRSASILVLVVFATALTIHGELRFSFTGFCFQFSSQLFECTKIVLQAMLLSSAGKKLDALTYVMLVMPLCAICLAMMLGVLIWVHPNEHMAVPHLSECWHWAPHLFANSCVAFCLNVVIALFVKHSSAVAFILAGVVKDAMIVFAGVVLLSEVISGLQTFGFIMQLGLIMVYSLAKTFPDQFEPGIFTGLCWVFFGMTPAPSAKALDKDYGSVESASEPGKVKGP
jgi:hypothetical protein